MIWKSPAGLGPGEARTRQRRWRQTLFLVVAGFTGGLIGFLAGFFDQGDGHLFGSDWNKLVLDPGVAIGIAVLLAVGFAALPIYGFRTIDELKRELNFIGFTGGCIAVLAGFPVWAVLHAGGLVPPPRPEGIWLLAFISMIASYAYARWRL